MAAATAAIEWNHVAALGGFLIGAGCVALGVWLMLDATFRSVFAALPTMSDEEPETAFRSAGKSRAAALFFDEMRKRGLVVEPSA
jgi:hypothetical protein